MNHVAGAPRDMASPITQKSPAVVPRPRRGISSPVLALALALLAAVLAAGCGGRSSSPPTAPAAAPAPSTAAASQPFAWLRASAPPRSWRVLELPGGSAALALPPGYARTPRTDFGTISAAPGGDPLLAYLNVTPRQGDEQLAGWAAFRLAHNRAETMAVVAGASAERLSFRNGASGSCLFDDYTARSGGRRYRELACIVRGTRASNVIVAAAPLDSWPSRAPELEAAVSGYLAR
jgi:hypothetical protein